MMAMMTLEQAARWMTQAEVHGDPKLPLLRVHTDTRTLLAGDLFVALKGEKFDANEFLPQAKLLGATAAICDDAQALVRCGLGGCIVPDTRRALGELASGWRNQFRLPLICVTGSNGKTTVTQMIAAILRSSNPSNYLATQGNFNNEIGLPLTLLRLRPDTQVAVLEVGMNHPGEIAKLAAIARPSVALVNNAQREHMEFMRSVEAVALENGAVISALDTEGVAVFPADDEHTPLWRSLAGARACLEFSDDPRSAAAVRCLQAQWTQGAWQVHATSPVGTFSYQLHIAGQHNLKNSLAAASCAISAGIALKDVASGLSAFEPVKGRSRLFSLQFSGRDITVVDDSYNANPDSVAAAIEVLSGLPAPRLLVLGDMGEVGMQGPHFHAQAGELARVRGIEALYTLGDLSISASRHFGEGRHFQDIEAMNTAVIQSLGGVGSILVKGSRFMRMERVVASITAQSNEHQGETHAA